jgi:hypothetical protein
MKSLYTLIHFIVSLNIAFVLIALQAYVLADIPSLWLHLDLLAVYVFYVGLEHHAFGAVSKIIVVSLLFESLSAVPAGFCLMAHLIMMFLGNRVAVWLEMEQRVAQLTLFTFLLVLKEALFVSTLGVWSDAGTLSALVLERLPGLVVTVLIAVPLMELMAWIDNRFDARFLGEGGARLAVRSVRV